jgi:hypothetical protein
MASPTNFLNIGLKMKIIIMKMKIRFPLASFRLILGVALTRCLRNVFGQGKMEIRKEMLRKEMTQYLLPGKYGDYAGNAICAQFVDSLGGY